MLERWAQQLTRQSAGRFTALERALAAEPENQVPPPKQRNTGLEGQKRPELALTCGLDAPRELVWKAQTDAGWIAQVWSSRFVTASMRKLDVRPGGAIRVVLRSPDRWIIR